MNVGDIITICGDTARRRCWEHFNNSTFGLFALFGLLLAKQEMYSCVLSELGQAGFCPHVGATLFTYLQPFAHNSKTSDRFSLNFIITVPTITAVPFSNLPSTSPRFSAYYNNLTSIAQVNLNKLSSWLNNLTFVQNKSTSGRTSRQCFNFTWIILTINTA